MRQRRLLVRSLALALACALAAGAAACGGDDDDDSGAGAVEGAAPRTVSGGDPLGPVEEGIDGAEAFRVDSRTHTQEPLVYDPSPPVGGEHFPVPATCGFYTDDPPPDSMLVHDLEHGAVWIAYDPGLDRAQADTLRALVAEQPKVTATPYEGLDSPLVVSAWARQLRLDDADDPRLPAFIEQYRNGPEAPEPAAPCQGIGDPEVVSPVG
ncbi:MAG: DUF3105 domain-containing protein [Acidimicrobiales bacterium]